MRTSHTLAHSNTGTTMVVLVFDVTLHEINNYFIFYQHLGVAETNADFTS